MKALSSIAIAAIALTCTASAPAKAGAECVRDNNAIVCVKPISASIDRVGVKHTDGNYFIGEVTCLSARWILHGGWDGSIGQAEANAYAEAYCEGRGSMFAGA